MDFYIKRDGAAAYAVYDGADTRQSRSLTLEDAQAKLKALQAAEREGQRERAANDPTIICWTAARYTAVEWFQLLTQDRSAIRKVVRDSCSAATPIPFKIKDAYRLEDPAWLSMSPAAREKMLARYKSAGRPVRKSSPWLLEPLLPVGSKRLQRMIERDVKAEERWQQYLEYRKRNPGIDFSAWEQSLRQQKRKRDTNPATKARRSLGAPTRKQVLALKKKGLRHVAIAKQLGISPEWVSRILKKNAIAGLKT